jgi:hypothetical protein
MWACPRVVPLLLCTGPQETRLAASEIRSRAYGLRLRAPCAHGTATCILARDGNGYPRPDTRWVFTPLEYVCGLNILPVGLLLDKNLHPMGKRVLERSTFTHTR